MAAVPTHRESGSEPAPRLSRLEFAVLLLAVAGMLAGAIHHFTQSRFVPAADWAMGLILPILLVCMLPAGLAIRSLMALPTSVGLLPNGRLKRMAMVLGMTLLLAYGLLLVVYLIVPATHALLVRDDVTHAHVVDYGYEWGVKRCPDGLVLRGLPPGLDVICGVSPDLAAIISSGQPIAVSGTGSRLGQFVRDIQPLAGGH